jgi:hypothetical protein
MSFATYSNINVQLRTLSDSGTVDGESRRPVLYGHGTGTCTVWLFAKVSSSDRPQQSVFHKEKSKGLFSRLQ